MPKLKLLIKEKDLKAKVKELAEKINNDYQGKEVLLVGVLKGAIIFLADLIRQLKIDIELDFIAISSYGSSTKTSGVVRILKDLEEEIENRHVILVEDITDSGLTLSYLTKNLKSRKPKSLKICSLLVKKSKQKRPLKIKYKGFQIRDYFVVGYGLDYKQQFRNLRHIYSLELKNDKQA